jgi:hypothetical protein
MLGLTSQSHTVTARVTTVEEPARCLAKLFRNLVDVTGFEPATPWLQTRCSPS